MKQWKQGLAGLIGMLLIHGVNGQKLAMTRMDIERRIAPVSAVEVEAPKDDSAAASGPRTGEAIFNAACGTCHASEPKLQVNAPLIGDAVAWEPRQKKGMEALINSVVNGLNAMPAMGLCQDCNTEEIERAIRYLLPKDDSEASSPGETTDSDSSPETTMTTTEVSKAS